MPKTPEGTTHLTIYVPNKLHKLLKIEKTLREDPSLSRTAVELIAERLRELARERSDAKTYVGIHHEAQKKAKKGYHRKGEL
jgi:hypothetical protein